VKKLDDVEEFVDFATTVDGALHTLRSKVNEIVDLLNERSSLKIKPIERAYRKLDKPKEE